MGVYNVLLYLVCDMVGTISDNIVSL